MKNINYLLFCALISFTIVTADISNIFQDVREGNKEAIKKRLENCEDCSAKDNQGNNALHIAIEENNTEIVEMLTTAPKYAGWMDWFYAFVYAPTLPNINEKNNNDETPLHCTIKGNKQNITKLLLQKHANMEIVNKENLSAVFAAIKNDAPHFIPIFVAHNLDLTKHRRDGETILHYAIKEKKSNSIHYCIQETSLINASNNKHQTPVLLAIEEENFVILDLLYKGLNVPADNGIKPIHYATRNGKCNVINYLLQHNIAIDEPDREGNPALFYAISQDNVAMVNYLLARGANLQKRNNAGEDAFAIA
jgi:ankyrin repeat protein